MISQHGDIWMSGNIMKRLRRLGSASRSQTGAVLGILLLASLCFVFLATALPPSGVQTVASQGTVGSYSSLRLDSNGNPCVAFADESTGNVKFARWDGFTWVIQTVDLDGSWVSFDLDPNHNPHVAYVSRMQMKLVCAEWNGSDWTKSEVASGTLFNWTSIVVDSNDVTHITYSADGYGLRYASGSAAQGWSTVAVDTTASPSFIALDSNASLHFVFVTPGVGLLYSSWDGSAWNNVVVDAGQCNFLSLAFDANGTPYVGYCQTYQSGSTMFISDLKLAKQNGAAWGTQTVSTVSLDIYRVGYNSVAVDANGNPHMSFVDPNDGFLKYARWTGTTWMIQTVDSSGFVGEYNSLALDSLGNVQISYYDNTNNNLKYTSFPIPTSTPTPAPTASPTPEITATITPTPSPTANTTQSPSPNATETPAGTYSPTPLPTWPPWAFETPTPTPSPTATPSEETFWTTFNIAVIFSVAAAGIALMHLGIYFSKKRSRKKREALEARRLRRGGFSMPPGEFPPEIPPEGMAEMPVASAEGAEAGSLEGVPEGSQIESVEVPLGEATPQMEGQPEGAAEPQPVTEQGVPAEPLVEQPVEEEQQQYRPSAAEQYQQYQQIQQERTSQYSQASGRYSTPMRICPRCHKTFRDFYTNCPYCRYVLKKPQQR